VSQLQTRALDERADTRDRRAVERLETIAHQRAVRATERHDVGDGSKRDELDELVPAKRVAQLSEEPPCDDQRDARPGELLVDREVAGPARVHHGEAFGQHLRWMVVVGDDEVDPERTRQRRFADRGDAAVDRDDDARSVRGELAQRLLVEAVALLVAVRDVRTDHDTELPEGAHEDRRTGDAVHVVVPIDDDALASRERTTEPLDRAVQVEHRRAVALGPRRDEISHLRELDPARGEDPRDERRDAVGRGERHLTREEPAANCGERHL
jgi:hypothetical protein